MEAETACALCSRKLKTHESYVVRIDVFADPSAGPLDEGESAEPGAAIDQLLEQMKHMTADELQDQVHRRFEYRVCAACQRTLLANPLGLPRRRESGQN